MDLYNHPNPLFTRWIIENRVLREKFVVVDVGCQGGEHPRWSFLGDSLEYFGFDPLGEVITRLRSEHRPGRNYYELGLGNEDGERDFFVPTNSFSASFYPAGLTVSDELRRVRIRRLDTLFASGELPAADHIKLDCEGFEPEILRGARQYLESSGPLCVTSETNFGVSPTLPYSHYQATNEILVEHRLLLFDLNIVRAPRPAYRTARVTRPLPPPDPETGLPDLDIGPPTTLDAVFCRDFVAEDANPAAFAFSRVPHGPVSVDTLIKAIINFELHGLMDCGFEITVRFREKLQARIDVDKACELLLARPPVPRNTADVVNCLNMIGRLRIRLDERLDAERLAARQRIRELEAELAAFRRAHADAVDRMMTQWTAERQAFEKRIREALTKRMSLGRALLFHFRSWPKLMRLINLMPQRTRRMLRDLIAND